MKKKIVLMLAFAAVMSLAGCGSSQQAQTGGVQSEKPAETTTTTAAAAETEAPKEEAPAETTAAAESSVENTAASSAVSEGSEEGAVTTAAEELDLDEMMSSVEALIPDITVFTGMEDIKVTIDINNMTITTAGAAGKKTEKSTTTKKSVKKADEPKVTTAAAAEGNVTSMYSLIFDGTAYTLPISGTLPLPAGWTKDPSSDSRSVDRFVNNSYKECEIDEVRKGGDALNGVFIAAIHAMENGKAYPSLQMYKGITWGSTVDEIKAQYGEPYHTGNYEQYGCNMTSLYYVASDNSYLILQVADKYGLALVEMYR